MTETVTPNVPAVVLRRTYKASRQRLFDAWTKPEIAVKFLGPGEVKAQNIKMDVRSGGAYSLTMLMPDGSSMNVGGVYRDVRPPERLSMTWRWEEDDPADEYDTLIILEFNERGDETELVLRHEQIKTAESRDNHKDGWTSIIDELSTVMNNAA